MNDMHTRLARRVLGATCLAVMLAAGSAAYANRAAGDACAAALPADAQAIYAAAVGQVVAGADPRTVVMDVVKPMVMSGQISRSAARDNAEAAAPCLKQAKS
ncbi:hypothetical protein [Ancylobacter amanitiformis]|uniref:Chlorophyllide reductase n=1 Tax=Ancylobacter amanitiformis TaxID=217069 RepID=A0ABU0LPQ0_9HYPH|nr:hypothetical protein [Ancylobacter amanitiformis]MDQ0510682.1 hypothetical protein [Ancylobacter amanitiformis]